MNKTDQKYWNDRYLQDNTPWDIGYPSPPLIEYVEHLNNPNARILIPGCGNAYEAIHLFKKGYKNVDVIDISPKAIEALKQKVEEKHHHHLLLGDFFELDKQYDLVLEQTFFCALHPSEREKYVEKMYEILARDGKLAGVLFNIPLNDDHPPYGGDEKEYRSLFSRLFEIETMETATNSIQPRQGNELFIRMKKKEV